MPGQELLSEIQILQKLAERRKQLEEMERQHQLGELVRRTRRAISANRFTQAETLAAEANELAPDTTTVEELLGDVAMAQKRYEDARRHFERALAIGPSLLGVNARNLKTLAVDPDAFARLVELVPAGVVPVAESGIGNLAAAQRYAAEGACAVLVGEALVTDGEPRAAVAAMSAIPSPGRAPLPVERTLSTRREVTAPQAAQV